MSAFGSSAINKSNKKIAPKAQAQRRRPAATVATVTSEQSSARTSIERRDAWQTSSPTATRPTASSPPEPTACHEESQPTAQSLTKPPTPRKVHAVTGPGGIPILCSPEDLPLRRPTGRTGRPTPVSDDAPAQEPTSPTRETRHADPTGTKGPSEVGENNTTLPPFAALHEAISGQEPPSRPSNKRRRLDQPQILNDAPSTAHVPKSSVARTAEPSRGSDVSADEQPTTTNAPRRAAAARGRRRVAAIVGDTRPDIDQMNDLPAPRRRGRPRAMGKSSVGADSTDEWEPSISGRKGSSRRRRHKRTREKTPDDAENVEIVSSVVKMSDLCKDTRTGKRSERSREIERMSEATRKQRARREVPENGRSPTPESPDQRLERLGRELKATEQGQVSAPRMRLVNGKMVLDETSLQVDRHANAAALAEPMEQVEESTLTRPVNSGTWGNREKSVSWSEESTDRFYNALRMFGTDFGMISKMFPERSRRQIKLKFNKEERAAPERVAETLSGPRQHMDIAEFSELTMTEYQDPEAFALELEAEAAAHAEEQKRQYEALQETLRQTHAVVEEVAVDGAAGNSSAKENQVQGGSGTKKGKRSADKKKKNLHSRHGGGEEVEIVGTIDR